MTDGGGQAILPGVLILVSTHHEPCLTTKNMLWSTAFKTHLTQFEGKDYEHIHDIRDANKNSLPQEMVLSGEETSDKEKLLKESPDPESGALVEKIMVVWEG